MQAKLITLGFLTILATCLAATTTQAEQSAWTTGRDAVPSAGTAEARSPGVARNDAAPDAGTAGARSQGSVRDDVASSAGTAEVKTQGQAGPARTDPRNAIVWGTGDIRWSENRTLPGARSATLWGDPSKGPYGVLKSMPPGAALALHTHSHDQRVIVVSGTVGFSIGGGPSRDLTAGSYAFIPGGLPHAVSCRTGADCVFYEESEHAADITFVGEPGSLSPPER